MYQINLLLLVIITCTKFHFKAILLWEPDLFERYSITPRVHYR